MISRNLTTGRSSLELLKVRTEFEHVIIYHGYDVEHTLVVLYEWIYSQRACCIESLLPVHRSFQAKNANKVLEKSLGR
jgi:hypothetical protein